MDKTTKILLKQGAKYSKKRTPKTKRVAPYFHTKDLINTPPVINVSKTQTKRGRPPQSQARAEAVKNLRDSLNKLRARIKRVEARYGKTPSIEEYYKRQLDKLSTRNKSLEEIGKMQEEVDYISGLKTTYVEGAGAFEEHIQPLIELYEVDKDTYNKIYYIYNRMVEEYAILEKFKYQVLDLIGDMAMSERTSKEIYEVVRDFYDELYEGEMEDTTGTYGYRYNYGGKVRPKY